MNISQTDSIKISDRKTEFEIEADIKFIKRVLFLTAFTVILLILVGGTTRLTNSGLSITAWRPISGILPPLSDDDWLSLFAMYQKIPQYMEVNYGMSLGEFKIIYWWEWGHRFLARIVGIIYALPLIYLALNKRIPSHLMPKLIVILFLGGLQGYIGWYMVQSGLSERTSVSHYRLALHFSIALLILCSLLWTAWTASPNDKTEADITNPATPNHPNNSLNLTNSGRIISWLRSNPVVLLVVSPLVIFILIYLQMVMGAFTAGLHAGWVYNTWPLIDGALIPNDIFQVSEGKIFLDDHLIVQWIHRNLAYVIFGLITCAFFLQKNFSIKSEISILFALVIVQLIIGIATLLSIVALPLALLHQFFGVILFISALYSLQKKSFNN